MSDESTRSTALYVKNQCPNCGMVAEAPGHLLGEMVACPNPQCGQVFRVDAPRGEPIRDEREADAGRASGDGQPHTPKPIPNEDVLFVVHPALVRQRPMRALLVGLAGLLGIAALLIRLGQSLGLLDRDLVPLAPWMLLTLGAALAIGAVAVFFWWWLLAMFTTLTVTSKRTTYREGIISRETSEVQHDDVRNLQIDQSIVERLLGIGDIAISSAGQGGLEIVARAIPAPTRVAEVVRQYE